MRTCMSNIQQLLHTIPHELVWKAVRIHERRVKRTYDKRQRLIKKMKIKKEEEKTQLLEQRTRQQQDRLAELSQRLVHDEHKKKIAVQQHLKEREELAEKKRLELEGKERRVQEKMEKMRLARENEIENRRETQRKIDISFKMKLEETEQKRMKRCEEKEMKVIQQVERAVREAELHKKKSDELASKRAKEVGKKRRGLEKTTELQRQKLESKRQRHQERISRIGYQKEMHRKRVEDAKRSEILLRYRLEEMTCTAKHFGRYDDETLHQMSEAESALCDFPSLLKRNPSGERTLRSAPGMGTRYEEGSIMSSQHSTSPSKRGGRRSTACSKRSSIQKSRKRMCELCKYEFDPELLRYRVTYRKIAQFREVHGVDGKFNLNKGRKAGTMYDLARVCTFCRNLLQTGFDSEKKISKGRKKEREERKVGKG
jgi:hypothetical protein